MSMFAHIYTYIFIYTYVMMSEPSMFTYTYLFMYILIYTYVQTNKMQKEGHKIYQFLVIYGNVK